MKGYYDITGDGGSNVVEQVEAQERSIARSLSGVRHIVAVGSGKGGVGKSTLTMQLACALRELGKAVSILDADLNGPCQARLGGLQDRSLVPGEHGARVPTTRSGTPSRWQNPTRRANPFIVSGSSQNWAGPPTR